MNILKNNILFICLKKLITHVEFSISQDKYEIK